MRDDRVRPYNLTLIKVVYACAEIGTLRSGVQVRGVALKSGLETQLQVRNEILNMYCKCGDIGSGEAYFQSMMMIKFRDRAVSSYEYMIRGYGLHFYNRKALTCELYNSMIYDYGITPLEGHKITMETLLGRTGRLSEAISLIAFEELKKMNALSGGAVIQMRKLFLRDGRYQDAFDLDRKYGKLCKQFAGWSMIDIDDDKLPMGEIIEIEWGFMIGSD
ncbi:putative pentatricopeptide repeat-containing protein At5g13230, mitochondrial [Papaver somniferum]|uniref:putative pentatricopeptide repeat-containing protein At5g13230, mitochondrial n=1 Tax=Papaver somniferum TaxID=3469 RepID=UPI000E6FFD1A|nr:putative pentatricopeptide repeat-containing protein At5g13230, mitochondrial [Papaver somniferum]